MLSQDVKIGSAIRMDGKIYFCIDFQHVKPGKGNTIMRIKLKDVMSGNVLEKRFDIGVKLEDVRVEHRPYQYLYKEGEDFMFMHTETYDQIPIPGDSITGVKFMKENDIVDVIVDASTETILYAGHRRDGRDGPRAAVHQHRRPHPRRYPHGRILRAREGLSLHA